MFLNINLCLWQVVVFCLLSPYKYSYYGSLSYTHKDANTHIWILHWSGDWNREKHNESINVTKQTQEYYLPITVRGKTKSTLGKIFYCLLKQIWVAESKTTSIITPLFSPRLAIILSLQALLPPHLYGNIYWTLFLCPERSPWFAVLLGIPHCSNMGVP